MAEKPTTPETSPTTSTDAPNVAKLIRTWVNENPELRKIIQFNTIGDAALLGADPQRPE